MLSFSDCRTASVLISELLKQVINYPLSETVLHHWKSENTPRFTSASDRMINWDKLHVDSPRPVRAMDLLNIAQYSDTKTSSVISSAARLSARGQFCAVEKPASRLRPKAGSSTAFRHPTSGWRNSARNDMVWGMSLYYATFRSRHTRE